MWICVLNTKCLLSKPFPADTWAQLECKAEPSCYHIWPMSCQPQPCTSPSTALLYRWAGVESVSSIVFWLFIQIFMFLTSSFYPQRLFFWVSAAGYLLVSIGWGCRSPPDLEVLGLQPRLHLLRQSLQAPVVTLDTPHNDGRHQVSHSGAEPMYRFDLWNRADKFTPNLSFSWESRDDCRLSSAHVLPFYHTAFPNPSSYMPCDTSADLAFAWCCLNLDAPLSALAGANPALSVSTASVSSSTLVITGRSQQMPRWVTWLLQCCVSGLTLLKWH